MGPEGTAVSIVRATLPEGVEKAQGAVPAFLESDWCGKLGYLRITGSMESLTTMAFHKAVNMLKGMEALLLDCRSMGGGADKCVWSMVGRFFPGGVDNGALGRIKASGTWQFDGPIVLLQDEIQVSAAESFTMAMSETERAVTVGRRTGGWSIVPEQFECPSGLASFLMGVDDRLTPTKGIRTEGTGWPPDITVPYGPVFCARPDPVREVGLEILKVLHAGARRKNVVETFGALFEGEVDSFRKQAPMLTKGLKG